MEVEKGKVILFLLGCLLLAGCGQEAESGGQQADVPESAVIAATVDEEETNTETVNAEMKNAMKSFMKSLSLKNKAIVQT